MTIRLGVLGLGSVFSGPVRLPHPASRPRGHASSSRRRTTSTPRSGRLTADRFGTDPLDR